MIIYSSQTRVRAARPGFSIAEIVVAIGILGILMVVVAQTGYWSMQERLENIAKQLALEHANNILEAARAMPFEHLNEQWAADVDLPEPTGRLAFAWSRRRTCRAPSASRWRLLGPAIAACRSNWSSSSPCSPRERR